ncbi:MAG: hypothetical protein ACRC1W_09140 [Shewanella sp.]
MGCTLRISVISACFSLKVGHLTPVVVSFCSNNIGANNAMLSDTCCYRDVIDNEIKASKG